MKRFNFFLKVQFQLNINLFTFTQSPVMQVLLAKTFLIHKCQTSHHLALKRTLGMNQNKPSVNWYVVWRNQCPPAPHFYFTCSPSALPPPATPDTTAQFPPSPPSILRLSYSLFLKIVSPDCSCFPTDSLQPQYPPRYSWSL